MSTVKTSNLQNGSSSSVNIALNTDGSATFAQMPVGPSYFAMRNKIINGAMEIDQRNSGASVTYTNTVAYGLDRWRNVAIGTSLGFSVQQISDAPAGFSNSLRATVTSAKSPASTDQARVNQYIEGFNIVDLAFGTASAKPITVSFWVKSSITGTYCIAVMNADSGTRSYVSTYTINVASTWEYKTITIPGDVTGTWTSSNSVGLGLSFALGSGSTYTAPAANTWNATEYQQTSAQTAWISNAGATWQITGVQLEVGSVATQFERRIYNQELAMCQRYYERGTVKLFVNGITGAIVRDVIYKVTKRSAPSLAYTPAPGGGTVYPDSNEWVSIESFGALRNPGPELACSWAATAEL